jgi:hypothetical protein
MADPNQNRTEEVLKIFKIDMQTEGFDKGVNSFNDIAKSASYLKRVTDENTASLAKLEKAYSSIKSVAASALGGVIINDLVKLQNTTISYNSTLLSLSNSFVKYGNGIGEVEKSLKSVSYQLGLTRDDTAKLFKEYERGFPTASLTGAEKLFKNIQNAVGSNVDEIQKLLGATGSLIEKYPTLQASVERLNTLDKARLASTTQLLLVSGKLGLEQYKSLTQLITQNKQISDDDKKRNAEIKNQQENFGKLKNQFEGLAISLGKPMLDFTQKILPQIIKGFDILGGVVDKISNYKFAPMIAGGLAVTSMVAGLIGVWKTFQTVSNISSVAKNLSSIGSVPDILSKNLGSSRSNIQGQRVFVTNLQGGGFGGSGVSRNDPRTFLSGVEEQTDYRNNERKTQNRLRNLNDPRRQRIIDARESKAARANAIGKYGGGALRLAGGAFAGYESGQLAESFIGEDNLSGKNGFGTGVASQFGKTASSAAGGALAGAQVGAFAGPLGMATGAIVGAIGGLGANLIENGFKAYGVKKEVDKTTKETEEVVKGNVRKIQDLSSSSRLRSGQLSQDSSLTKEEKIREVTARRLQVRLMRAIEENSSKGRWGSIITGNPDAKETLEIKSLRSQLEMANRVRFGINTNGVVSGGRTDRDIKKQETDKQIDDIKAEILKVKASTIIPEKGIDKEAVVNMTVLNSKIYSLAEQIDKNKEKFEASGMSQDDITKANLDLQKQLDSLNDEYSKAAMKLSSSFFKLERAINTQANLIQSQGSFVESVGQRGLTTGQNVTPQINVRSEKQRVQIAQQLVQYQEKLSALSTDDAVNSKLQQNFDNMKLESSVQIKKVQEEIAELNKNEQKLDENGKRLLAEKTNLFTALNDKNKITLDSYKAQGGTEQALKDVESSRLEIQTKMNALIIQQQNSYLNILNNLKSVAGLSDQMFESNKGVLDSLIANMQNTGNIDLTKLNSQITKTLIPLEKSAVRWKKVKEESDKLLEGGQEGIKTGYQSLINSQADAELSGLNKSSEKYKDQVEIINKKRDALLKIDNISEMEVKIAEAGNRAEIKANELSTKKLNVKLATVDVYNQELSIAGQQASIAKQLVGLADSFAIGVGASSEMRLQAVAAMRTELSILRQQLAVAKAIMDDQSQPEDARRKGQEKYLELQSKIYSKTQEINNEQRAMRDGWVSAISAAVAGQGSITKFLITQNQNMAAGAQYAGILRSNVSGAINRNGENVGTRGSERGVGTVDGQFRYEGSGGVGYESDRDKGRGASTMAVNRAAVKGDREALTSTMSGIDNIQNSRYNRDKSKSQGDGNFFNAQGMANSNTSSFAYPQGQVNGSMNVGISQVSTSEIIPDSKKSKGFKPVRVGDIDVEAQMYKDMAKKEDMKNIISNQDKSSKDFKFENISSINKNNKKENIDNSEIYLNNYKQMASDEKKQKDKDKEDLGWRSSDYKEREVLQAPWQTGNDKKTMDLAKTVNSTGKLAGNAVDKEGNIIGGLKSSQSNNAFTITININGDSPQEVANKAAPEITRKIKEALDGLTKGDKNGS